MTDDTNILVSSIRSCIGQIKKANEVQSPSSWGSIEVAADKLLAAVDTFERRQIPDVAHPNGMKLFISEPEERHQGTILIHDEALNDIAEFYHNEHATVDTSYETALMLANALVAAASSRSSSMVGPPDPRGPFFSTQWEREDWERRQRGERETGPASSSLTSTKEVS